eukprot:contig_17172_g4177
MLAGRACVIPVGDDDCAMYVWVMGFLHEMIWCVSPGIIPSFFLPSMFVYPVRNACIDLPGGGPGVLWP